MRTLQTTRLLGVLLGVLAPGAALRAEEPGDWLGYQGVLSDAAGATLTGSYDFEFALFADATDVGSGAGTAAEALWTEAHPGVLVQDGRYGVTLGASAPGLDDALGAGGSWLEIRVRAAGESTFDVLAPRVPLASVPSAYRAGRLDAPRGAPGVIRWNESDGHWEVSDDGVTFEPLGGPPVTEFDAAQIITGTLGAARLPGAVVLEDDPAGPVFLGPVTAPAFSGNGAGLTNVDAAAISGVLAPSAGGTGLSSWLPGMLLVGDTSAAGVILLPPGLENDVLTIQGGVPVWRASSGTGGGGSALELFPTAEQRIIPQADVIGLAVSAAFQQTVPVFEVDNGVESILFTVRPTGEVGIGTSFPTTMLEVAGDASFFGGVTAGSFAGDGMGLTGVDAATLGGQSAAFYDHTIAGYLTSFTELDPAFGASPAAGILAGDITNWNTAFSWGDHAAAGYLTSFTELDPAFGASPAAGILAGDITNWNTAFSWGNHAAAGYLTGASSLSAANLTGALPALDGAALTNLPPGPWTGSPDISYMGGNVGIGTASPTATLDVGGTFKTGGQAQIAPGTFSSPGLAFAGDASNGIFRDTAEASNIKFKTGGGLKLEITSTNTQIVGGYFSVPPGSATNPNYTFNSDTDNGIFAPGANQFAITTGGVERLRVSATGMVGIGTTAPGSALDVKGTLRLSGATSGFVGLAPAANAGAATYTLPAADGSSGSTLTTNGAGVLAWTPPPPATKSILIDPGMIDLAFDPFAAVTKVMYGGWQIPCLAFPDAVDSQIQLTVPVPADWDGSSAMTLTLLWSAVPTAGSPEIMWGTAYIGIDGATETPTSGGANSFLTPSATSKGLAEHNQPLSPPSGTKIMHVMIRRKGSNASDTLNDVMRLFGVRINYQ